MSAEDAAAAAVALDALTSETIDLLANAVPGKAVFPQRDGTMATTLGGKDTGNNFRMLMQEMRKQMDAFRVEMTDVVKDANEAFSEGRIQLRAVRADVAEFRAAFRSDSNEPQDGTPTTG